jgi:hypothetical protein
VSLPWRQVSPALNKNTYFGNAIGGRLVAGSNPTCGLQLSVVVSLITPRLSTAQQHTNRITPKGERKGEK